MDRESKEFELRKITYGELHLMMNRLAIDVLEHPEYYSKDGVWTGEGISEFIDGERWRRGLDKPLENH